MLCCHAWRPPCSSTFRTPHIPCKFLLNQAWTTVWRPRVLSKEFECQILKYSMRRLVQHWTASSIIPISKESTVWRNKKFKKRTVSFAEDRSLTWSMCEYFRITGANDSVENYADLFTFVLRNDDVQEFDSKWDGILSSMTKIPPDDFLEGLYKLRTPKSEKLSTVLKYRARFTKWESWCQKRNYERNVVVKNQGTKQRGQRTLGDCWQKEAHEHCSEGDNFGFRHDINKLAKMTQPSPSPNSFMQQNESNASSTRSPKGKSPSGGMSRWPCKDYLKGTCTNSFCEKWHPPEFLFYKSKSGCRFGEKFSYAHRQIDKLPAKMSKKEWWQKRSDHVEKYERCNWTRRPVVCRNTRHDRHELVVCDSLNTRRSFHRFYGTAQTYGNQSDV